MARTCKVPTFSFSGSCGPFKVHLYLYSDVECSDVHPLDIHMQRGLKQTCAKMSCPNALKPLFRGRHADISKVKVMYLKVDVICDTIKGNESHVGNIQF